MLTPTTWMPSAASAISVPILGAARRAPTGPEIHHRHLACAQISIGQRRIARQHPRVQRGRLLVDEHRWQVLRIGALHTDIERHSQPHKQQRAADTSAI